MNCNLKSIMYEQGISVNELGLRTGLANSLISSYREGKTTPNIKSAYKIATALNNEDLFKIWPNTRCFW